MTDNTPLKTVLIRYGAVPEVAKLACPVDVSRGDVIVANTHRGVELGRILEVLRDPESSDDGPIVLRKATLEDQQTAQDLQSRAAGEYHAWEQRIRDWGLDLQLIDMEWTLDAGKLILYVLNERGPECTKLAIQAAAAGLGIVDVQPVGGDGLMKVNTGSSGGCGSCGCH